MHYRSREKKSGATRKDAKNGDNWVVKIKSKWLCFVNNHDFRETEREETHQPVSLVGKRSNKTIESWGGRYYELASLYAECCVLG
jgi:tRNA U34 2-thiouridine synthase MnmA/TrmU